MVEVALESLSRLKNTVAFLLATVFFNPLVPI